MLTEIFSYRRSFGFETPNAAAAFFSTLLPFLYFLRYRITSSQRAVLWKIILVRFLEFLLMLLLVLTQSRAGLLGALVALLVWILFKEDKIKKKLSELLFQGSILSLLILASSLGKRFALVTTDLSVINRLNVWYEALDLIAASPACGWGKGMAGVAHFQWTQTLTTLPYSDMLNGYLQIAVDFGLLGLFIALIVIIFPYTSLFLNKSKERKQINVTFIACLAAYSSLLICHFFSTLWIYPSILYLSIGIFIINLYSSKLIKYNFKRQLLICGICSQFLVLILLSLSLYKASQNQLKLSRQDDDAICLSGGHGSIDLEIYLDNQSLGIAYGKVVRQAFKQNLALLNSIKIHKPGSRVRSSCQAVMLIGASSNLAQSRKTRVYVIAPTREPCADNYGDVRMVYFQEYDQAKIRRVWAAFDCPLINISDCGVFIANDFSKILSQCCKNILLL